MNRMEQRVRDYIEEKRMILPGDTVVVGVSGGADSLCLFLILYALGAEMNFHLHVVHVHHGLRESAGEEMDQVGKAVILDDGEYHYAVTVMVPAAQAKDLTDNIHQILNSIYLE